MCVCGGSRRRVGVAVTPSSNSSSSHINSRRQFQLCLGQFYSHTRRTIRMLRFPAEFCFAAVTISTITRQLPIWCSTPQAERYMNCCCVQFILFRSRHIIARPIISHPHLLRPPTLVRERQLGIRVTTAAPNHPRHRKTLPDCTDAQPSKSPLTLTHTPPAHVTALLGMQLTNTRTFYLHRCIQERK